MSARERRSFCVLQATYEEVCIKAAIVPHNRMMSFQKRFSPRTSVLWNRVRSLTQFNQTNHNHERRIGCRDRTKASFPYRFLVFVFQLSSIVLEVQSEELHTRGQWFDVIQNPINCRFHVCISALLNLVQENPDKAIFWSQNSIYSFSYLFIIIYLLKSIWITSYAIKFQLFASMQFLENILFFRICKKKTKDKLLSLIESWWIIERVWVSTVYLIDCVKCCWYIEKKSVAYLDLWASVSLNIYAVSRSKWHAIALYRYNVLHTLRELAFNTISNASLNSRIPTVSRKCPAAVLYDPPTKHRKTKTAESPCVCVCVWINTEPIHDCSLFAYPN